MDLPPLLLVLQLLVALLANCTTALEDKAHWMLLGQEHLRNILTRKINTNTAKNIIIFVGDGMGVATVTAARIFKGQQMGQTGAEKNVLAYERFPSVGLIKTYNVDKQVPDSAGTGTAIFTGVKTNYGVLGVDARVAKGKCEVVQVRQAALESIMTWAQKADRLTGIVTTTRVTHATPSSTFGRSPHREWECDSKIPPEASDCVKDLARQLVEDEPGRNFRVILGGGLSPLGVWNSSDPKEDVCRRTDGRNLAEEWLDHQKRKRLKAHFVRNWGELLSIDPKHDDAVMGLFSTNHMDYEAERRRGPAGSPSLLNMTVTAVRLLQKGPKGFVLVVEGGLIDQAHHNNWARLALTEAVGMEAAVEAVLKMTSSEDTLVVVTADHSHAMTINGYPSRGSDILGMAHSGAKKQRYETITYANGPGFHDHLNNNSDGILWLDPGQMQTRQDNRYRHFAPIWENSETHGGEDIAVYATGPFSHLFNGVHEQNYIAHAISCAGRFGPNAHFCKSHATAPKAALYIMFPALFILLNYCT